MLYCTGCVMQPALTGTSGTSHGVDLNKISLQFLCEKTFEGLDKLDPFNLSFSRYLIIKLSTRLCKTVYISARYL